MRALSVYLWFSKHWTLKKKLDLRKSQWKVRLNVPVMDLPFALNIYLLFIFFFLLLIFLLFSFHVFFLLFFLPSVWALLKTPSSSSCSFLLLQILLESIFMPPVLNFGRKVIDKERNSSAQMESKVKGQWPWSNNAFLTYKVLHLEISNFVVI